VEQNIGRNAIRKSATKHYYANHISDIHWPGAEIVSEVRNQT